MCLHSYIMNNMRTPKKKKYFTFSFYLSEKSSITVSFIRYEREQMDVRSRMSIFSKTVFNFFGKGMYVLCILMYTIYNLYANKK